MIRATTAMSRVMPSIVKDSFGFWTNILHLTGFFNRSLFRGEEEVEGSERMDWHWASRCRTDMMALMLFNGEGGGDHFVLARKDQKSLRGEERRGNEDPPLGGVPGAFSSLVTTPGRIPGLGKFDKDGLTDATFREAENASVNCLEDR